MQEYNLKEALIKIELAIKKNEFDLALMLYEEINKNWEEYEKEITPDSAKNFLKLSEYIEKLLLEKRKNFFDRKNLLQLRKAYSKF
ncbi:MAG: hypothetical protein C0190_07110 [Thermodesulfobacterium geofontis]|uniref:Uncharacterized protein n=1 Tax=Thermodesulfobacterium geofontis TaxID=1295609 RepID=A0A2N7PLQ6_9BACT|nr:MAG: hypothetical protein C0190_07110 [Thermodesulfobacterium geofontis]